MAKSKVQKNKDSKAAKVLKGSKSTEKKKSHFADAIYVVPNACFECFVDCDKQDVSKLNEYPEAMVKKNKSISVILHSLSACQDICFSQNCRF